jgi:hypothetical protein
MRDGWCHTKASTVCLLRECNRAVRPMDLRIAEDGQTRPSYFIRRIIIINGICESSDFVLAIHRLWIPLEFDTLLPNCLATCGSLESIAVEPGSILQQVDERALSGTGIRTIGMLRSVEVVCKSCCSFYRLLSSIWWCGLRRFVIAVSVKIIAKSCFLGW